MVVLSLIPIFTAISYTVYGYFDDVTITTAVTIFDAAFGGGISFLFVMTIRDWKTRDTAVNVILAFASAIFILPILEALFDTAFAADINMTEGIKVFCTWVVSSSGGSGGGGSSW